MIYKKLIPVITKINYQYNVQSGIMLLSPLFSSKKIDSARFNQRAFFCPSVPRRSASPECGVAFAHLCVPTTAFDHTSFFFPARPVLRKMSRVKTSQRTYARLWRRFDELAATTDAGRRALYHADGKQYLALLIAKTLRGYDDPCIASAEEFSNFIMTLRADFSAWNHRLMGLMTGCDEPRSAGNCAQLHDFALTCPWKILAEAARDF